MRYLLACFLVACSSALTDTVTFDHAEVVYQTDYVMIDVWGSVDGQPVNVYWTSTKREGMLCLAAPGLPRFCTHMPVQEGSQ